MEYPHLKLITVANLVTRKDNALHKENRILRQLNYNRGYPSQPSCPLKTSMSSQRWSAFFTKMSLSKNLSQWEKYSASTTSASDTLAKTVPLWAGAWSDTKGHPCRECQRPATEVSCCCNCGKTGHLVSYRECPFYKFMVARKEAVKSCKINGVPQVTQLS